MARNRGDVTGTSFPTSFDLPTILCERLLKSSPLHKSVRIPQRVISSIIGHRDTRRLRRNSNYTRANAKNRETFYERDIITLCDLEHFREILAGKQPRIFLLETTKNNRSYDRRLYRRAWKTQR